MRELGGLWKLFRLGSAVKGIFDAGKNVEKHHAALLADDDFRRNYCKWWDVHLLVRSRPELVKEMTNEGRQRYQAFKNHHEEVLPPRLISASEEAKMLATLKRYDELMQDCDRDDPHARIEAWNLSLAETRDDANE